MKIKKIILLLAFSFLFGFSLLGPTLQSSWGAIDDHEIALYLEGNERITLTRFSNLLGSSEFAGFGKSDRYRPTYYLFRITETLLWGDNVKLWYLARIISFSLSFYLLLIISRRFVSNILAIVLNLYIFSLPVWKDIFARLGPSEIYGLPLFLLFIWGYLGLFLKSSPRLWIVTIISSLLVSGTKENYLFIPVFLVFLLLYKALKRSLKRADILFCLICMAPPIFVQLGVSKAIFNQGVDYYLNPFSISDRLLGMLKYYWHFLKKYLPFLFLFGCFVSLLLLKKIQKSKLDYLIEYALGAFLSFVLISSQLLFYNNRWPTNIRYDFPGILVLLVLFWGINHLINQTFPRLRQALVICLLFLFSVRGFDDLNLAIIANSERTNHFYSHISQIKNDFEVNPSPTVLFESCNVWDYEPLESVKRYLSKELQYSEIKVLLSGYSSSSVSSDLEKSLATYLESLATSKVSDYSKCYSISLSCPKINCSRGVGPILK